MNFVETASPARRTGHAATMGDRPEQALAGEYLAFRIAAEEYGIDLLTVQEIRQFEAPTRMAGQRQFLLGVINLRGVIVPVVDLRTLLGAAPKFDAGTVSVVLNVRGRTVALVVDAVLDVLELSAAQIKPTPSFSATFDTACIAGLGVVRQGDTERLLILVDVDHLLAAADMGVAIQSS